MQWLLDSENLVCGSSMQNLMYSAWPSNLNVFNPLVPREAEVRPTVA